MAFYQKGEKELIQFYLSKSRTKKKELFREMESAFTCFRHEPDRFILRYPFRNVSLKKRTIQ
jgi:hypothetical protein